MLAFSQRLLLIFNLEKLQKNFKTSFSFPRVGWLLFPRTVFWQVVDSQTFGSGAFGGHSCRPCDGWEDHPLDLVTSGAILPRPLRLDDRPHALDNGVWKKLEIKHIVQNVVCSPS